MGLTTKIFRGYTRQPSQTQQHNKTTRTHKVQGRRFVERLSGVPTVPKSPTGSAAAADERRPKIESSRSSPGRRFSMSPRERQERVLVGPPRTKLLISATSNSFGPTSLPVPCETTQE